MCLLTQRCSLLQRHSEPAVPSCHQSGSVLCAESQLCTSLSGLRYTVCFVAMFHQLYALDTCGVITLTASFLAKRDLGEASAAM